VADISWKAKSSGAWTVGQDWSSNSVPGASDDVTIDVSGITVTISSGAQAVHTLYTYESLLALTGGSLTIGSQGTFEGYYNQSGGDLVLRGEGATFEDGLSQSAGTISVQSGAMQVEGTGSLAGTVSGAGSLVLSGGTLTLASTAVLSIGKAQFVYGTVNLSSNFTYAGACAINNANFVLNGHKLTLTGGDVVGGYFSQTGTVALTGSGQLAGLSLDGSVIMTIGAVYSVADTVYVGGAYGSTAQLQIAAAGTLRVTSDAYIAGDGSGTLSNAGLLVKAGGAGLAEIGADLVNTGTLSVLVGGIELEGANNTLGGHVSGAGTLEFYNDTTKLASGLSLTVASSILSYGTVTLGGALSYAGVWGQDGGTLSLASAASVLTLSGPATLDEGTVEGSGTLSATGVLTLGGIDIEGAAQLVIAGNADQTGTIDIGEDNGSTAVATIAASGVWRMSGGVSVYGDDGTIVNDGTLEKLGGSTTGTLFGTLTNMGTIDLAVGNLDLDGAGSLGGTIEGQGALIIDGTYSLAAGVSLLNQSLLLDYGEADLESKLSYAGTFTQSGGTLALDGYAFTAASGASLDDGYILGGGTMTLAGSSTLGEVNIAQDAVVAISGTAEQTGDISVGYDDSAASLSIAKGAVYTLDDSVTMDGSGTLSVTGTLSASGIGTTTIDPAVVDLGTVKVGDSTMLFDGAVSGKGLFLVGGSGTADFDEGVASSTTVSFAAAGASIYIEAPADFAASLAGFGSGDAIELYDFDAASSVLKVSGKTATIADSDGDTITLHFTANLTASALYLGVGADGGVALFHS
jgi:hypothetical protein